MTGGAFAAAVRLARDAVALDVCAVVGADAATVTAAPDGVAVPTATGALATTEMAATPATAVTVSDVFRPLMLIAATPAVAVTFPAGTSLSAMRSPPQALAAENVIAYAADADPAARL